MSPRIRVSIERSEFERAPTPRRGNAVRRSRRSLMARWLKPLAAMLALAAGPAAAMTWLMTSPRFAVRELSVVTGERVPELWVRQALAGVVGDNLPRLPLARAQAILRDHPWVESASLRKDLPARLVVRVVERQAVALLRADDGLHYLDARGVRIAPFDPSAERGVDLPLISVVAAGTPAAGTPAAGTPAGDEAAVLRPAVRLLSEIDEVGSPWIAGMSEVEILGEEDFRLHTSTLPFPVLVKIGTLNQRARRLEELLPHIVERYGAAAVDLRFARRIIVQPSVAGTVAREPGARQPVTDHRKVTSDHAQRG
jgi:cell division protein FtsQ